ncbi:fatty acid desaturase [Agarilytica rhodophyticola]|uniref:fatty acid desaturase n=1 Tax=Agarilytica rhodophyticola TaxID=1737490 RepID=UPI000CD91C86
MILTIVRFSVPTRYKQAHLKHHRYIGSEKDTEKYKQYLNTKLRRIIFSTFIGVKLAHGGKLSSQTKPYLRVDSQDFETLKKAKIETLILRIFIISLLPLSFIFPKYIVLGFLIPSIIITPIAGTFRVILEHTKVNTSNDYHIATHYKTNLFSQVIFLWDSGDCHLIHHIFPSIPFYRMRRANNIIRPFLLDRGVIVRTSFFELLHGWYIKNYPHRSLWSNKNH